MAEKKRVSSSSRYKRKEGPKVRQMDNGVWGGSSLASTSGSAKKRKGCGCGGRLRKEFE